MPQAVVNQWNGHEIQLRYELHGRVETPEQASSSEGVQRPRLLIIPALGGPVTSNWFSHVVRHFAGLLDTKGQPLVPVCIVEQRGIGESSVPDKMSGYSTTLMAQDCIHLLDQLGWKSNVHVVGMSLSAGIAIKLASAAPEKIGSLFLMAYTRRGWYIILNCIAHPFEFLKINVPNPRKLPGVLHPKLDASLNAYFSHKWLDAKLPANQKQYVCKEALDGRLPADVQKDIMSNDKTRRHILHIIAHEGARLGASNSFMGADQSKAGRNGHVKAMLTHNCTRGEWMQLRHADFPITIMNGRYDPLIGKVLTGRAAKQLGCNFLITDATHAGVTVENAIELLTQLELSMFGITVSSLADRKARQQEAFDAAIVNPFFIS
ncbi:hypothetical protein WJX84_008990 [Apatococcus fuscideae]|uniref:AB hydrolase-1 domain-containing protein n=1 Tax=Apatococcus fuscideae TaxID=2026836 RepID=A0AAW1S097_9CHLO